MNLNFDKVMRCVNFLISASSLYQSQYLHQDEIQLQQKLTKESIDKSRQLHHESIKLNKKTYLVDMFLSLEQHFQQLNADLIGSSRESTRDMFDQRNQQLQTIILSSSVMFSALSTVIIQGPLNTESSRFLVITYSLVCSLSFASLFITIVICIEVVMRASKFMYRKSKNETTNLRNAVENTRSIIKVIRNKAFDENSARMPAQSTGSIYNTGASFKTNKSSFSTASPVHPPSVLSTSNKAHLNNNTSNRSDEKLVEIAKMSDEEIHDRWEKHEKIVHEFLQSREAIIDFRDQVPDTSPRDPHDHDHHHLLTLKTFDAFWHEKCQFWSDFATLTFYIGTLTLLVACMIFMWSEYDLTYESGDAAVLAVVIIGVSLIVGVVLGVSLRFNYFRGSKNKNNRHRQRRFLPRRRQDNDYAEDDNSIYVQMTDDESKRSEEMQ